VVCSFRYSYSFPRYNPTARVFENRTRDHGHSVRLVIVWERWGRFTIELWCRAGWSVLVFITAIARALVLFGADLIRVEDADILTDLIRLEPCFQVATDEIGEQELDHKLLLLILIQERLRERLRPSIRPDLHGEVDEP